VDRSDRHESVHCDSDALSKYSDKLGVLHGVINVVMLFRVMICLSMHS
jgi:hypothetical protein